MSGRVDAVVGKDLAHVLALLIRIVRFRTRESECGRASTDGGAVSSARTHDQMLRSTKYFM